MHVYLCMYIYKKTVFSNRKRNDTKSLCVKNTIFKKEVLFSVSELLVTSIKFFLGNVQFEISYVGPS